MSNTAKTFFRGAATTNTATVLYTVPALTSSIVTQIVITNTANTAATYTIGLGGINFATSVVVAGYDSTIIDLKQPLTTGETITGGASATTVNFHIVGVELT